MAPPATRPPRWPAALAPLDSAPCSVGVPLAVVGAAPHVRHPVSRALQRVGRAAKAAGRASHPLPQGVVLGLVQIILLRALFGRHRAGHARASVQRCESARAADEALAQQCAQAEWPASALLAVGPAIRPVRPCGAALRTRRAWRGTHVHVRRVARAHPMPCKPTGRCQHRAGVSPLCPSHKVNRFNQACQLSTISTRRSAVPPISSPVVSERCGVLAS